MAGLLAGTGVTMAACHDAGRVAGLAAPPGLAVETRAQPVGPGPGAREPASVPPRASRAEPATVKPGTLLTFDRAFAVTARQNANLSQMRSAVERARVNYRSVSAGYASDWQARLIGNAEPPLQGNSINNRIGSYYDQAGAELQWQLPWWHKEGVKYDAQSAQIDIGAAESRLEADEKDQAVNLLKAYVQVRLYQEKVRVSEEQLRVDRARRDFMAQGAKLGSQSDLAVTLQEADLQNQQAATAHLRDVLGQRWQSLFNILNVPEAEVQLCRNYFAFFTFDPAFWPANEALEEQTRGLKIEVAKQDVLQQKSLLTWMPDLALRASYGRQFNESATGTRDVANLGAVLTVPLPNRSQSAAQQELARHDMNDLLARLDQKILGTQRLDAHDRARIPVLASSLRFRLQAMKENEKRLADTRRSFQLGLITYLEVETVENSITQSTQQFYDDLAEYIDAVADFARLHGRPFPIPTSCSG